jgi:hypothetical protein
LGLGAQGVDSVPPIHDTLDINVNVSWKNPTIVVKNQVEYPNGGSLDTISSILRTIADSPKEKGDIEYISDDTGLTPHKLAYDAKVLRIVRSISFLLSVFLAWMFFEFQLAKYDKRHLYSSDMIRISAQAIVIFAGLFTALLLLFAAISPTIGVLDLINMM